MTNLIFYNKNLKEGLDLKVNESKFLKLLIFSMFYMVLLNGAYALNDKTNYTIYEDLNKNSINIGVALLNGKSEELVYVNGKKLSELTWELENVPMFGLEVERKLASKTYLNISAWTKLANGSGEMNDYDWLDESGSWTHHSNHKTNLEKAYMLNLNVEYELLHNKNHNFSTSIGFRHDRFKWEAYDGEGTYLNSDVIFYGKGITYDQKLYAPYIGLDFNYKKNSWSVNMYLRGSFWAWGEATDVHHSPAYSLDGVYYPSGEERTFKDNISDIDYLSYGVKLNYFMREDILIGLAFDFQDYLKSKGEGEINGVTYDAGLSHYSYMISMMTEYRF